MRGHQIRHEELVLAETFIQFPIPGNKTFIHGIFRLSHLLQNRIGDMLRCHLELPAHMVLHKFSEKSVIAVCKKIVKTDSGTDKNFFDARKCP